MEKDSYSYFNNTFFTKLFGILPDGKEVFCHTLCNKNGIELSVISYGATLVSLKIPTSTAGKTDVILGFDTLEDYVASFRLPGPPYFGAVIGRFCGRINQGRFNLYGKKIQLNLNHGSHHLHGGNTGFSQVVWDILKIKDGENPSITLSYTSTSNEENYPGTLYTEVTYTLTETNEVAVEYKAQSTEDTIVNITQHSYFNLEGHQKSIADQLLFINSVRTLETDTENIPSGLFLNVSNCPFDFTETKKCPASIDNTFILHDKTKIAASLYSEITKLKMNVFTNQPAVHVYIGGNCFGKIKGKENADYHLWSGICFETQNFPDAPNHAHFPDSILKKGELYHHQTLFAFEIY